jgi:SAM-dependent methyltransferase
MSRLTAGRWASRYLKGMPRDTPNAVAPDPIAPHGLLDGTNYLVRGGSLDRLVFRTSFGHRRAFRQMTDLEVHFSPEDLTPTTTEVALLVPVGPPMPSKYIAPLNELLVESEESDAIREAFCKDFSGSGYELGPGRRPTIVPLNCTMTYIDKFTFEMAKDGSFLGLEHKDFPQITHYEAMDDLKSVPDASCDFFIACHVIEHVPNVIGAIRNVVRKLAPGGVLFMVVPNKETIFDRHRPTTSLEHLLVDDIGHEPPMLEHYLEYSRLSKGSVDWIEDGKVMHEAGSDFHAHTFTAASMTSLLTHLQSQGIVPAFEVFEPKKTNELGEFYVRIAR